MFRAAGLAAVALLVRMIGLDKHFLLIDEAFVGVAARDIAFNKTPMWDAVSNAPYVWGLSQVISIIGDSELALRAPSALFGALTSVLIFLFVRRWANEGTALLSAAIYALHPFAVAFTRVAFVDALQLPAICLAIFAIDRSFETRHRAWLLIALASAAVAFIFKYNAIAVIGCWMFAGLILRRYPFKRSLWVGLLLIVASFATLLLWPYDAPAWFFSFLAKGGSYDGQYIWDFYQYAYRHVTFGSATLPIAMIAYLLIRRTLDPSISKRYDQHVLFGFTYFGLLLFLGRPFQRYLLVLTVPVAIVYATIIFHGLSEAKHWFATHKPSAAIRGAAGIAVLLGVLIQGYRAGSNYIAYLNNDLDLAKAAVEVRQGARSYWPFTSISVAGYYLGFDQYYSLATQGPLSSKFDNHYFLGSPDPHSQDTLAYGVLFARRELQRIGFMNAILAPKLFADRVMQLDASTELLKNSVIGIDYYHSDSVRPGDLLVDTKGTVDQNGEPMLYPLEAAPRASHAIPEGFSLFAAYVNGKRYNDTSYTRRDTQGEVRILIKNYAE